MIKNIKIYKSDSFDPYKNLAIERALLDTVDDSVILYLWQNENTVVIGRNQNPWAECKLSLLESDSGKLARRLSGGGAVFHDTGNLNFTFICKSENYNLALQLEVIKSACALAGISAEVSGRNDILADGRKFSGNAFYNSKEKSYHHGTLLISADLERAGRYLTPSKAKLEAKGVKSVRSRIVNLSELAPSLTVKSMRQNMMSAFEKVYKMKAEIIENIDSDSVSKYEKEFKSWDFLYGRSAPFSLSCEDHFSWGHAELKLNVTGGVIDYAKLYTDSMDYEISERVENALTSCKFNSESMEKALSSRVESIIAKDILSLLKKQVF